MVKKLLIIVLIIGLIGLLYIKYNQYRSKTIGNVDDNMLKPPPITVICESKIVEAKQGTYSWFYGGQGVDADYPAPDEIVKTVSPYMVKPNSEIKISFSYMPKDIKVRISKNDNNFTEGEINDYTIKTPTEKGIYIYEIEGIWTEGRSWYVFIIEVS